MTDVSGPFLNRLQMSRPPCNTNSRITIIECLSCCVLWRGFIHDPRETSRSLGTILEMEDWVSLGCCLCSGLVQPAMLRRLHRAYMGGVGRTKRMGGNDISISGFQKRFLEICAFHNSIKINIQRIMLFENFRVIEECVKDGNK